MYKISFPKNKFGYSVINISSWVSFVCGAHCIVDVFFSSNIRFVTPSPASPTRMSRPTLPAAIPVLPALNYLAALLHARMHL